MWRSLTLLLYPMMALAQVPGGSTFDQNRGVWLVDTPAAHQAGRTVTEVLLPKEWTSGKRYPVLYILPVEKAGKSEYGSGMDEAVKADVVNRFGVICVQPSFIVTPWYGNHAENPEIRQEDFLAETLVPMIDGKYPTVARAENRWLLGFSKSGWGACTLLMRRPETFGYAAAWDVPFLIDGEGRDWGPYGLAAVMGTPETLRKFLPARLAAEKADALRRKKRLVLGVGEHWKPHCVAMHELLDRLAVPHAYRTDLTVKHHWAAGWFLPMVEELAAVARTEQD